MPDELQSIMNMLQAINNKYNNTLISSKECHDIAHDISVLQTSLAEINKYMLSMSQETLYSNALSDCEKPLENVIAQLEHIESLLHTITKRLIIVE